MDNTETKIFIAGHRGMVGSAILRKLYERGFSNIVCKDRNSLDLTDQENVKSFFDEERPEYVIIAAARVGGIQANISYPADFLYENLAIQNNLIHQSYLQGVEKICFLGSSCIYPKECPQPMKEEYLLTGRLEPTNEGYAIAKIAGVKMVDFYNDQYGLDGFSVIPCNLYGTNDDFNPLHSHVLSATVKKFVDAVDNNVQNVTIWGTGVARREFMHVDDAAEAILFLMNGYRSSRPINVGWGEDISIKNLATIIGEKVGFRGEIIWDESKPDGMLRKCMDISRISSLGYKPKITLDAGITRTIEEYKKNKRS
jgi:GDP-L-fucose synthase